MATQNSGARRPKKREKKNIVHGVAHIKVLQQYDRFYKRPTATFLHGLQPETWVSKDQEKALLSLLN